MAEKMSQTDAVLYAISMGRATIDECLRHGDAEMRRVLRREWLVVVGATLDTARGEVERLRAENAAERERCARICECSADEYRAIIEDCAKYSDPASDACGAASALDEAARAVRSGEPFRLEGESDESFEVRCAAWEAQTAKP